MRRSPLLFALAVGVAAGNVSAQEAAQGAQLSPVPAPQGAQPAQSAPAPAPQGAQPAQPAPVSAPQGAQPAQPAPVSAPQGAQPVQRDPQGVTGISPLWEAIQAGDGAYVARQFKAAFQSFQEAIRTSPQSALAHARAGEAARAGGDLEGAEAAFQAGARYAGNAPIVQAKLLFLLADIAERKGMLSEATARWEQYHSFVQSQPRLTGNEPIAQERLSQLQLRSRMLTDYGPVKQRIEERARDAAQKASDSAP